MSCEISKEIKQISTYNSLSFFNGCFIFSVVAGAERTVAVEPEGIGAATVCDFQERTRFIFLLACFGFNNSYNIYFRRSQENLQQLNNKCWKH